MSKTDLKKKAEALAKEFAKEIKSQADMDEFSRLIRKVTYEAALGAEMDAHLGYAKHAAEGRNTGNSRNGHSQKRLIGDHGELELAIPAGPQRQL